jgi:hypothetical protein
MNRFAKATLASIFAASVVAGPALAADSMGAQPADQSSSPADVRPVGEGTVDQDTTGSIAMPNMLDSKAVSAWESGDYSIKQVSTLDDGSLKTQLMDKKTADAAGVADLQSAIEGNAALSSKLKADNVQINNIVAAEKAADGSVTFYVQ